MKKLLFLLFALACAAAPARAKNDARGRLHGRHNHQRHGPNNHGRRARRARRQDRRRRPALAPRRSRRARSVARRYGQGRSCPASWTRTATSAAARAPTAPRRIQPDVRVLDAVNVRDTGLQRARAGGITTVNIMPGSGHLLSGPDGLPEAARRRHDRRPGHPRRRRRASRAASRWRTARTRSARTAARSPARARKSAALVREQFVAAQDYREKIAARGRRPDEAARRATSALEALVEVLDGKRVVHLHTHRHDDILTVLRLREEFGFRVVLHHVSEGWKVADEIARAGVAALDHRRRPPGRQARGARRCAARTARRAREGRRRWSRSTPTTGSPTRACSCARAALAVRAGHAAREGRSTALTLARRAHARPAKTASARSRRARTPTSRAARGDPLSASTRTCSRPGSRA